MQKVAGDPGVCISAWDPPPRPPFSCPPVCAIRANCRSRHRPPMVPRAMPRFAHIRASCYGDNRGQRRETTATAGTAGNDSDSDNRGRQQRTELLVKIAQRWSAAFNC